MKQKIAHKRQVKSLHSDKNKGIDKEDLLPLITSYTNEEQRQQFIQGWDEHPVSGLLINPHHTGIASELNGLKQDESDKILYRFDKEEDRMGKSLLHFGGGFYILDPSSAAISFYLDPLVKKGDLGIDLCAAPGGKSIAFSFRRPDIFLLANDISYPRALEIVKNTDRLGLTNIASLSMDPENIPLDSLFDFVILDAPCSGSGMFRKDPKMLEDYSEEKVKRLLPIQEKLLEKAHQLVKKDGIIAYSTCSLSTEEDEEQIKKIISKHPDLKIIKADVKENIIPAADGLGYHLVPGIYNGEGIYFIFLKKTAGEAKDAEKENKLKTKAESQNVFPFRHNEYVVDRMFKEISSLPFLSPGIKIHDDSEHPKCEFDHAFSKVTASIPLLEVDKTQALSYVSGNEITVDSPAQDGLYVLTYHSLRLGFARKLKSKLKNLLPKGLRVNLFE